jgi:hypothetical protein
MIIILFGAWINGARGLRMKKEMRRYETDDDDGRCDEHAECLMHSASSGAGGAGAGTDAGERELQKESIPRFGGEPGRHKEWRRRVQAGTASTTTPMPKQAAEILRALHTGA